MLWVNCAFGKVLQGSPPVWSPDLLLTLSFIQIKLTFMVGKASAEIFKSSRKFEEGTAIRKKASPFPLEP